MQQLYGNQIKKKNLLEVHRKYKNIAIMGDFNIAL